jgi:phage tail sheath protein FI
MFSIPSIPEGLDTNGAITYVVTTASLKNRGEVGAVYWPNVIIPNPNKAAYGNTANITLQVSSLIAGLYSRVDGSRVGGVYDEPAGTERGILRGIVGLESTETQQRGKRNLLYPENINPLWKPNGNPIIVDGSRILDRGQNFPSVAQRRGVIFIETSVDDGLIDFVHRANNDETREEVANTIRAFLLVQFRAGAFRGDRPSNSYFVDVSEDINPPTEVNLGRLNVRVGLATNRPAEFIILRFSQDLRDLEAELAASS